LQTDACVFSLTSQILYLPIDTPHRDFIRKEAKNLEVHCDKIKKEFWPDWKLVLLYYLFVLFYLFILGNNGLEGQLGCMEEEVNTHTIVSVITDIHVYKHLYADICSRSFCYLL
jgi:hypothetical protein